ncbi:PfkB family carbohydrate kinase [Thermogemmatispora sp.]|uniref:PfkB family carbohydrate kinase n=1 Tax=Thermogemmatispora sp. TaxID=1968838 RepID=UPI001D72A683|nr:PfkB family carbohydrate kinase [Thermogemmatispora sp.]MBX5448450.1 sugar kinase [Thermogemmatispora sp.]
MSTLRLRPRRLVVVGSVLVDLLLYVERLPERGGDLLAQRALQAVGGGFNLLLGAVRLGLPAAYAGRVGDGLMGSRVRAELEALGIPLLLPPVVGRDTGFDIGLVEPDGERTFVTAPGVEAELSREELEALKLQEGDAVYISGYDLCYPLSGDALEVWLPGLAPGCLLVLDPGPLVAEIPASRLAEVLRRVDVLSLNARELRLLSGEEEPARGAAQLRTRLAPGGIVVARVGAEGCWLATAEGEPRQIAARPARVVVDTTGAGDAHVVALLAALAAGARLEEAAYEANVAASLAVERAGPATTPTREELVEALAEGKKGKEAWE